MGSYKGRACWNFKLLMGEYKLVSEYCKDRFQRRVNEAIEEGYGFLKGSEIKFRIFNGYTYYVREMVKYSEED